MIKCAACTPWQAKQIIGQMRLFYGMIDSPALNAFAIFTENVLNFGEHKKDKRQKFFNWPLL